MKIYVVYELVSSAIPGNDVSCADFHKAFTSREEAKKYIDAYINAPEFKWKNSLDADTFTYVDYDVHAKKRFAIRPEYVYEEGEPEDENRLYVEILIRELDLD